MDSWTFPIIVVVVIALVAGISYYLGRQMGYECGYQDGEEVGYVEGYLAWRSNKENPLKRAYSKNRIVRGESTTD